MGSANAHVSIAWPITLWAVLPAIALIAGGYVSWKLSGAQGPARFRAGAAVAIPYTILLLLVRPYFEVPSALVTLPSIPLQGMEFDTRLLPTVFITSVGGVLVQGLLFGVIFAGIGAIGGFRAIWRGLMSRDSFWPSYARGAVVALVVGQVVFIVITAAASHKIDKTSQESATGRNPSVDVVASLPTAGLAHYFSHGVTLKGSIETQLTASAFSAGMLTGVENDGKRRPMSKAAYAALLIPALSLILGGLVAAKTAREPLTRPGRAASFAAMYALILTALVPYYTLALRTTVGSGDMLTRATVSVGPSAAQTFVLGLGLAFVFGLVGISIHKPNASS
jgi:hypothetical protein